ncbi:hypothetical protein AGOR_G00020260 [Albula goreensis]|uniref:Fibronectin type-III domain-containing protein n=1 Tax=Albula goreensis TaxID=1534307 RepID=A0A8T3E816_9TELE|nr:hypothetical protein AGOR_G00020260 [Albula goreensis]
MLMGIFLFISHLGCVYSSLPNVSCTIINLEYIDCTWKDHGIPKFNYSFSSSLQNRAPLECPDYLLEENQPVGCRLPYEKGNKFQTLSTILFSASNHLNKTQEIKLQDRVKLHPPQNLSVQLPSSSELWLYWNVSVKFECLQYEVSYKRDTDSDWITHPSEGLSFSLPFPSQSNVYTFRVRSRVQQACHESSWSDWSTPLLWGPVKQRNYTEETKPKRSTEWRVLVPVVIGCIVVVMLICLLVQNERLRVILIPIVPNPSKPLEELLYTYNGNVEDWLHISKEFVEGFKPNFSEPSCPVREYSIVPQTSISGSECSLSILLDQSDCLDTSFSTATSSISASPENTPPGLV